MNRRQSTMMILGYFTLFVLYVSAAPVQQAAQEQNNGGNIADVEKEDKDLQQLLSLVNKEAHQDDVMVHRAHVTHIENNNGETVKVEQKEEKVLDSNTGEVIADVKQKVKSTNENSAATSGVPSNIQDGGHTIVETEVEVPSEGLHQKFVQEGESESTNENAEENNEESEDDKVDDDSEEGAEPKQEEKEEEEREDSILTPADIAAYLFGSQQFDAFYTAMDRLVNQSKMTRKDAEAYMKAVAAEYESLQQLEAEDQYEREQRSYAQSIPDAEMYGQAAGYEPYPSTLGAQEDAVPFDMLSYVNSLMTPEEQEYQAARDSDLLSEQAAVDPYRFVSALWTEAYENGNPEAQEIVRLLYDRVGQSSNPDDMGEIRDILFDTVSQAMDDPRYQMDGAAFETPMDTPIAMPQMSQEMPINALGAESGLQEAGSDLEGEELPISEEEAEENVEDEVEENNDDEEEEEDLSSVANVGKSGETEEKSAEEEPEKEEEKEEEEEKN